MKLVLPFTLLLASTGIMQAAFIEKISFDLSALHPGSTLSGTFVLPDSFTPGYTVGASLLFSDPSDYSPGVFGISASLTILSGTPSGYAVDFDPLTFTNLSGTVTPINTRDVILTRSALATCPSFCTATGTFQDRSPAVFTSTYTITNTAPEPGYAMLVPALLMAIVFGRLVRPTKTDLA